MCKELIPLVEEVVRHIKERQPFFVVLDAGKMPMRLEILYRVDNQPCIVGSCFYFLVNKYMNRSLYIVTTHLDKIEN